MPSAPNTQSEHDKYVGTDAIAVLTFEQLVQRVEHQC
jgi:hypothetical protein